MSTDIGAGPARAVRSFPIYRRLPSFVRDPLRALERIGQSSDGDIARLNLGVFNPYLVTHPDHVQHVLRDNAANYPREGMMWKPLKRLVGGISGEGPEWAFNRGIFQSLLSGPNIASITDEMAAAVEEAVDELGARAVTGEPVDSNREMVRIVHRAVIRAMFGDKISVHDADNLGPAVAKATTSFGFRMLLPFVPESIPVPGDRALLRAIKAVDDVMFPIIRASRRQGAEGRDLVSMLLRARDEHGKGLDDRQVRDGVVAMFVAGTETTATALSWLWVVLDGHPDVAERLRDEVDLVVGRARPTRSQLPEMRYTKMVLQELLRVYSIGWILPRTAVSDDVIDGFRIKGGSTVLVSPYLTHRTESAWERPEVFDPERFAPGRSRHRFAYLAFGAGPHQCVGTLFFTVEAQLILAALFTRFRPVLRSASPVEPHVGLTLRPRERVMIELRPVDR